MRFLHLVLLPFYLNPCHALELASSFPADGNTDVPVSASVHLRFSDALAPATLAHLTLQASSSPSPVAVSLSTDLTNASITISPAECLNPHTRYNLHGSAAVTSVDGVALTPFTITFTTGETATDPGQRLVFEPSAFDDTRSMTTVLFGPDGRLYAASAFGELVRWDIDPETGVPTGRTVLDQDPRKSRQYIDLEWDPDAGAKNLVLWVSYSERLSDPADPRHFFTGTIARYELEGNRIATSRTVVTGLPHGRERQGGFDTLPHQPNGLCFSEGKLYQSVGSTSSSGGPANWGVRETLLSGAIIEIDYRAIHGTLDAAPASGFDPSPTNSPLRVFATGVRNALEIIAHSNGRLYTAVNINDRANPSDGVPDDPRIPGDQNTLIRQTTPDHESLYILERGRHYGFPNPSRGHFVLGGGNPTADEDPFEIGDYPIGTAPEPGFAPELMFPIWRWGGTSPDGMVEYLPSFPHPLVHTILCCFYSAGDIAVLTLGSDGLPTAVEKLRSPSGKLAFAGPLDITQNPSNGVLYIADFGKQNTFGADGSLVMLRPLIGKRP